MPSLAQLLAAHGTLLVLDAASARVQVGWLTTDSATWASSTDEAGKALFSGVETVLGATNDSHENRNSSTSPIRSIDAHSGTLVADVGAFVFCEGPGSILGIRTAATAIRAWRTLYPQTPSFSYKSLALLAHALGDPNLTLIADARRNHWHVQRLGQPLRQVPSSELADTKGPLATPSEFRHWTLPPPNLARVPYDLETMFASSAVKNADCANALVADLFTPAPEPDAFLHAEATYKTWLPQIHRAPGAVTANEVPAK